MVKKWNRFVMFTAVSFIFFNSPQSVALPLSIGGGGGEWVLLHENIGISAMHMQLLHNSKVVIFDRIGFGSNISLPASRCGANGNCEAHSILYDIATNTFRPLRIETDTWCSSGSVRPDGTLVQTGGYGHGDRAARIFVPCNGSSCDWVELSRYLSARRWYATNQVLPDGRIIIVGGRGEFNYEFYPKLSDGVIQLDLLRKTTDYRDENNLYPFLHLLPDGNLFVFANTRSILLDYTRNRVVREFPRIPVSDHRNYPSSGSSVLLPLDENHKHDAISAEILVCGGAPPGAFRQAKQRLFMRASSTCGRLMATGRNPQWVLESMPIPRVMGDMVLLPNRDVAIINGAGSGTAGWELARNPVTRPLLYHPSEHNFSVMSPSSRPRMYHSAAILSPDGRVLVGGSNPHMYYSFTGVEYPTDLTLEAFSPPYLSPSYAPLKPRILSAPTVLQYRTPFSLTFSLRSPPRDDVSAAIIAPSFTTHSFSMNQRMVVLKTTNFTRGSRGPLALHAVGPSTPMIAPPGYYLLFLAHSAIPSDAVWIKITQ